MIPLPTLPKSIEKKDNYAKFVIEGLYPGYGITIGNALRRFLLSSLAGAAVIDVKIKGVQHEFSTISGVMEDVIHICLNLKKLRFKFFGEEPVKAVLKVKGVKEVKGKDFNLPSELELINKDQHIASLTNKNAGLEMEITVKKGIGYEPKETRRKEKLSIGDIILDAIYTPIKRVSYKVENMRVGERTDFDRLYIEIETDGTISPEQAFISASDLLIIQFSTIHKEVEKMIKEEKPEKKKTAKVRKSKKDDVGKMSVEDIKLSTRTANALISAHIKTIGGLIKKKEEDIIKLEGLGDKGLKEIKIALKKLGLGLKS